MQINKEGNLYRLSTYFNDYDPENFCHLCRRLVLNTGFIGFLCGLAGIFLGDLAASIAAYIATASLFWTPSIVIVAFVGTFFSGLCLMALVWHIMENNPSEIESIELVKNYYQSKKNKFCPDININ
jgi:hypothetical protein